MAHGRPNGLEMFELIKQIGKASYNGEVILARHKRDQKKYVLKKINLKNTSKTERSLAEQEAKLLSKLKHPNIVSYKDSFMKDGTLYIAMQYCEGGDLYTKLNEYKGQALEERQVVEWFVQIAMALQYMHERNILHRDLKTQNIFLTKSYVIKVGGLGIAKVLDSSSDMATTLVGTPYYMSPELFSNKPYNHKSDVWALGCCVYEMVTLKHAFNAKDWNSLAYKILRGKMPPMPKQYTPELLQIIKNMLHQDPEKRPTVNRILRDSYIKKNISIFLEESRKSQASSASKPSSAVGYSDWSLHPCPSPAASAPSSQDVFNRGKRKSKPVDKPHPLPPPPQLQESEGLPQHRQVLGQDKHSATKSKSSSSSRKDASWDAETPRSLPNICARQRRRNNVSSSIEHPQSEHSAQKVKLKRPEYQRVTTGERSEREPVRTKSKPTKIRQPSIQDDSSSSGEETLKENEDFKRDKEKLRENKEMNSFISLLDTTLNLNEDNYTSDEESPESGTSEEEEKTESPVTSPEIHRSASLPSVETLCSADKLSKRIQLLHKECVAGVGFDTLHKAYQILSNIEDDELEPQLVTLMGKKNFDLYAGKIWQLKFCEESLLQLPNLQS